jgi:hypothetical protein
VAPLRFAQGLDNNLLDSSPDGGTAVTPEDAGVGAHGHQLKELVNATAQVRTDLLSCTV